MKRVGMKSLILSLLAVAALTAATGEQREQTGKQTFTGTISDSVCANAGHTQMRMGPTDAECTVACVGSHDADYVLYDGKVVYVLSHHQSLEKLAGQKVAVIGSLDTKTRTIQIDSINAAK
jgi:hypothetical protein